MHGKNWSTLSSKILKCLLWVTSRKTPSSNPLRPQSCSHSAIPLCFLFVHTTSFYLNIYPQPILTSPDLTCIDWEPMDSFISEIIHLRNIYCPTQGLNLSLLRLLHFRQILYPLSQCGSPETRQKTKFYILRNQTFKCDRKIKEHLRSLATQKTNLKTLLKDIFKCSCH